MTTVKKMLQYLFNKSKKCYDLVKIEESDRNMAKYNKNLENLAKDILVKNDMLKLQNYHFPNLPNHYLVMFLQMFLCHQVFLSK